MSANINYNQPFLLLPNRVWRTYEGGRVLDQIEGKTNPTDSHFPEDWIGSATRAINPGREHIADEGIGVAQSVDGNRFSMAQLFATSPVAALGAAHADAFGAQPQLLVKLLDSAVRLHIQAHPNVAWARRHLNSHSGKTESWWVLQTRTDDAYVYLGFQHPPTAQEWRRIVDAQDFDAMLACFERIPVAPGDVLLVEGGVPHAIGPGITMVEIQEPTDYVVRCEYAHGGAVLPESARTMGLGLERVLDLFDYTQYPAATVKERFGPRPCVIQQSAGGTEIALLAAPQTDRLEVRKVACSGEFALHMDGRFSTLIVLDGAGQLHANGIELPLHKWSRVFLPAAVGAASLSGQLTLARCLPPQP
ncbi:MAG: class I mannose-6-phosphate isomerase [Caldilineaceae bacterium]